MRKLAMQKTWRLLGTLVFCALAACESPAPGLRLVREAPPQTGPADTQIHFLNRITWGANTSAARELAATGFDQYIAHQLKAPSRPILPPAAQDQIDALTITQRPPTELMFEVEKQRRQFVAMKDNPEQRKAAQTEYQRELTRLAREAATRAVLRALYSPYQLQEKMTWFWMNHFSVYQFKNNVRAMVADYEENAIRPHALGRFRSLLGATARHPAMLRYLDNVQNAVNRINENYARELMELHTLGAAGGYTQRDVQELARILTGVGFNLTSTTPNVPADRISDYVREGLFEFNPNRHDYNDKVFLGQTVKGRGLAELDEALDRLARHPATARFISRKLALYFVSDDPPVQLVDRMAQVFQSSDGDIAATLRFMFGSAEFSDSFGRKFKDPVHYVLSAVRFAYDDKPILDAAPIINWLNRMGEGLYNHQTPDGYPLTQASWASSGQMSMRFEIARAIGSSSAALFKSGGPQDAEVAAFPQFSNALYYRALQKSLTPATVKALGEARSPQEWNTYLLSSPEFMNR